VSAGFQQTINQEVAPFTQNGSDAKENLCIGKKWKRMRATRQTKAGLYAIAY